MALGRTFSQFAVLIACSITAIVLTSPAKPICAQEARIWADKSGKHEIKAKFVDIKDGKVRLERPNGDISRIPLDKLSEADQEYVKNWKPGDQAKKDKPADNKPRRLAVGDRVEAEWFRKWQTGTVTKIDYKSESVRVQRDGKSGDWPYDIENIRWPGTTERPLLVDPVKEAMSSLRVIRPDMSDVARPIADGTAQTSLAGDPRPTISSSWKPKPVRLQGRTDFHESPLDFAIVTGEQPTAMVLHSPPGVGNDGPGRIEIVDLRTRKSIATGPSLPGTKQLLLSSSGKMIATATEGDAHENTAGQLDFWSIEGKQVDHVVSFSPYVMDSWPNADPEWIEWLDNEQLFTVNREGRAILWQVEGAKAVYELMLERDCVPTLSPGKQQLAVPTIDGVQIYESNTGELLATVGSGNMRNAALAYSPSGRQLAAVSGGFVDVIDVTTGEITRSFPCEGARSSKGAAWVDEEYLFAANSLLIHVPKRIIAWKYVVGNSLSHSVAGTQWLLVDNHKTQILTPMQLPPPEAIKAVNDLNDSKLLAVQPGESVSIKVDIRDRSLAKSVAEALKAAVTEAGMQVDDSASLVLRATMKQGESEEINYRNFHDHFGKGETFNVNRRIYELQLRKDGATIWKRESVQSAPHHLRMEKGENIRGAIARVMKPTASNFRGRLPTYIVRPEYQEPLGTSSITGG